MARPLDHAVNELQVAWVGLVLVLPEHGRRDAPVEHMARAGGVCAAEAGLELAVERMFPDVAHIVAVTLLDGLGDEHLDLPLELGQPCRVADRPCVAAGLARLMSDQLNRAGIEERLLAALIRHQQDRRPSCRGLQSETEIMQEPGLRRLETLLQPGHVIHLRRRRHAVGISCGHGP